MGWAGLAERIRKMGSTNTMQQTSGVLMLRQVEIEMDNNMHFTEKECTCSCIGLNWSRLRLKAGFSITPVVLIVFSFFSGGRGEWPVGLRCKGPRITDVEYQFLEWVRFRCEIQMLQPLQCMYQNRSKTSNRIQYTILKKSVQWRVQGITFLQTCVHSTFIHGRKLHYRLWWACLTKYRYSVLEFRRRNTQISL